MERKVGEIFEYNGEWYQCIHTESFGCENCNLTVQNNIHCVDAFKIRGECLSSNRKDGKSVIFKKLEKVGEPYIPINNNNLLLQRYQAYITVTKIDSYVNVHTHGVNNIIAIEIQQNKENVEEKKLNLKPFDLEAAKAGKPVCTRDGRKARIISFDLNNKNFPIVAIINCDTEENAYQYDIDGVCDEHDNNLNLMMSPEKKEGWVNLCKNNYVDTLAVGVFPNREEAVSNCPPSYLCTIKIEWEE